MSLSQRVREYRYAKGWGPDELAGRASISRTALYQIETGKTEVPRAGTLRRIAEALDVPLELLVGQVVAHNDRNEVATTRRSRGMGSVIPSEGGPLHGSAGHAVVDDRQAERFGIHAAHALNSTAFEPTHVHRMRELTRKLHELLDSPLGEGVARIIDETYRLSLHSR